MNCWISEYSLGDELSQSVCLSVTKTNHFVTEVEITNKDNITIDNIHE